MSKICSRCKTEKDESEFNRSSKSKSGRHTYCRTCQKEHYQRNKVKHIANVKTRNDNQKRLVRQIIWDHLATHPCVDCGESDPIVLEFDHIDPQKKSYTVPDMVTFPVDKVKQEIAKCDIRCANCHKRRHARDRNVWKLAYQ